MTEIEILREVQKNNRCMGIDELMKLDKTHENDNADRIKNLMADGYLIGKFGAYQTIRLAPNAIRLIDEANHREHLEKLQQHEKKKDFWRYTITTGIAALSFLAFVIDMILQLIE